MQKGDIVKVMNWKKYLYDSVLYEFKLGKIAFIKAREYEVIVVETHHGESISMKEYCTGHNVFILCVSCILHFLMGICFTVNVSNISFLCAYKPATFVESTVI